jgi:hypothetical protein
VLCLSACNTLTRAPSKHHYTSWQHYNNVVKQPKVGLVLWVRRWRQKKQGQAGLIQSIASET